MTIKADADRCDAAPPAGGALAGPDGEDIRWERVARAVWDWHGKVRPWSAATAAARSDYRAGSLRALAVIDAGTYTGTDLAAAVVRAAFSLPSTTWRKMRPKQRRHLTTVGRLVIEAAASALPVGAPPVATADAHLSQNTPGPRDVSR